MGPVTDPKEVIRAIAGGGGSVIRDISGFWILPGTSFREVRGDLYPRQWFDRGTLAHLARRGLLDVSQTSERYTITAAGHDAARSAD